MKETHSALPTPSWAPLAGLGAKLRSVAPEQRVRVFIGAVTMLAVAVGLLAGAQNFLNDADTLWHIALGRDIWLTKSVPHADTYSYSFAGTPWIAKEWLSQVLLYGVYALGGWNGVVLLTMAVLLAVFWQLYWPMSREIKPLYAAAAAASVFALSGNVFLARPHILALPLLILFVHGTWTAARKGRAPSFFLLIAMVVWANMHGSFTFGSFAAGLAFLYYLYEHRTFRSAATLRWLVFLALCPVVSMINPYGFESIWTTVVIAKSEALPYIVEWRAFSAPKDLFPEIALLALVGASLASGFRVNVVMAVFLCFLVHMYLLHVRFVYLFFTLTPLLLAADIGKQFPAGSFAVWARQVGSDAVERTLAKIAWAGSGAIAALLLAGGVVALDAGKWAPRESYPIAAINAARDYGVTGNVMNFYGFGGALIFEGVPTFVDGRADWLFQNGFMARINESRRVGGEAALRKLIDDYDVTWTIFEPEDERNKALDDMPGWKRLYEDEYAVVHVREKGA